MYPENGGYYRNKTILTHPIDHIHNHNHNNNYSRSKYHSHAKSRCIVSLVVGRIIVESHQRNAATINRSCQIIILPPLQPLNKLTITIPNHPIYNLPIQQLYYHPTNMLLLPKRYPLHMIVLLY